MSTGAWARFRPRPTAPRGAILPLGVRGGCATDTTLDFAALAPVSTIADLTLDQTTIAWYVPDRASYDITLRLYRSSMNSDRHQWILVKEIPLKSKAGIMTHQIPKELLQEGQVYLWQAALACVPGYPSGDLVAQAQFKVVSKSNDLQQKLNQARDPSTKSELYAAAGLWYSAFMEAMPSNSIRVSLLKDLIEYERSQQSPDSEWAERGREHSESIAKIVEALRN